MIASRTPIGTSPQTPTDFSPQGVPDGTLEARANLYAAIARLYLHVPSASVLELFSSPDTLAELTGTFGRDAVAPIQSSLERGFSLAELRNSYTTLFRIPGPRYVDPFESVFMARFHPERGERRPSRNGPEALDCAKRYADAGAQFNRPGVALDHIGVEFEFMAFLVRQELAAAGNTTAIERIRGHRARFLCTHLGPWLPRFAARVQASDELGVYTAVTWMAQALVDDDGRDLNLEMSVEKSAC